jgi:tRNA A22 N-methylase
MSSSKAQERGSRLVALRACYQGQSNIWDIGCDHGHLGMSFENDSRVQAIHFVDPSPDVGRKLIQTLKDSYITKGTYYQKKGQDLIINTTSNMIFIAGMGGELIGSIISSLLPHLGEDSWLAVSPHRKILELRKILQKTSLFLHEERLIEDHSQFYQILCLSKKPSGHKVSSFGSELWEGETAERYLDQQLDAYSVHRDQASLAYVNFLKERKALKTGDIPRR